MLYVVAHRTTAHLDIHNLQELLQSAYKIFHSCESALVKVKDDILRAIDGRKCVLLVLLDLSAAFDTVDYEKLIDILHSNFGLQRNGMYIINSKAIDLISDKK